MVPRCQVVVIVDGYGAGRFLPDAFARHNADVVHLQSTPEAIKSMSQPDFSRYVDCIVHTTITETIVALSEYNVVAVVAGTETGVPLTDELSAMLGLPASNGTAFTTAKRNKFAMIETIRSAGLHCASQCLADSADELVAWAQQRDTWPIVIKPLGSASSDGVYICDDIDQAGEAAQIILDSLNVFDSPNHQVLGQSYLDGEEYVVDTVSARGQRFVVGVWQYKKRLVDGRNLYDREYLVPADDDIVSELVSYNSQVLKALGIDWGPTHSEIKMTSGGPALVEIGVRLNGQTEPSFHDVCLGHNQADLTALALVDADRFIAQYGGRSYRMRQPAVVCTTVSRQSGTIAAINTDVVREIENLESVHCLSIRKRPGQRVELTTDQATSPLRVYLTATTAEAIESGYKQLQELKDRVFII